MNLHLLIPMPTEAQLREWERGITHTFGRADAGPIRDPAFMPREPNPVVAILTEDGEVIFIEAPFSGMPGYLREHPVYGRPPAIP